MTSSPMKLRTTRSSEDISEWTKIFPKQIVNNYTSSAIFMKQLTATLVSTITYMKNIFPEEDYRTDKYAEFKIHTLKKKCRHQLAQFVSTNLINSLELFDKKCLDQLVLCIYEGECEKNVLEYHVFKYVYRTDEMRENFSKHMQFAFEYVRERTKELLRVVLSYCSRPLPEEYDISFTLYCNEDTPIGYPVPGLTEIYKEEEYMHSTLKELAKLGWVDTPYHKLIMSSYKKIKKALRANKY